MSRAIAILVARLIFAAVFAMAAAFKFAGMQMTADYIVAAGFPFPLLLAWIAAIFECLLALGFLTGAYFAETALLAAAYVIFLAFSFHGPSHWASNQSEFGFFVDHITFTAGLLFAAVKGPGHVLAIRSERESLFTQGVLSNAALTGALLLTLALQMAVLYVPWLNPIFKTEPLSLGELGACLALSSVVFVGVEIEKALVRRGWLYASQ